MHATNLAEVASWVAFNTNLLIKQSDTLSSDNCSQYWSQSKCLQNRWMIALKMFELDVEKNNSSHDPWPAIEIIVQEIFMTELLTRVWSAIMVAHDQQHGNEELTGIAHSVHIGQLESKNRAMRLLLTADSVDPDTFERLNGLRRKVERWTDLLLGQLQDNQTAVQFAFQPKRVKDFYEEFLESSPSDNQTRRVLFSASLADDMKPFTTQYAANPEINRRIAASLMGCFSADRFDSLGMPKSAQMLWMEKSSDDAQLLINDLDALDNPPPPVSTNTRGL